MALVDGFNHVAVLTKDIDRLARFYDEVFEAATVWDGETPLRGGTRHAFIELNPTTALHVFELPADHVDAMSGKLLERGRVDHVALSVPDESVLEEGLGMLAVLRGRRYHDGRVCAGQEVC